MSTTAIKAKFIGLINESEPLKVELASANGVKMSSINRWLREEGNEDLTTFRNLAILKRHFGVLEISELLEDSFVEAVDSPTR